MKNAKRIGAFICVFAICFTLSTAPAAHASGLLGGQAAGAWIAAGLVALNIVAHTGAQAIGSYFGWQAAPTSQSVLEYAFPNTTAMISDYMNAATIKIDQGITTIDGVTYDEVFIEPGTFTSGLKTNLFDFKTKWNILSGQNNITLAEGWGYGIGMPWYSINGNIRTPIYTFNIDTDSYTGEIKVGKNSLGGTRWEWPSGQYMGIGYPSEKCYYLYIPTQNGSTVVFWNGTRYQQNQERASDKPVQSEFHYQYTSGIVPATESDIPQDYGLSIQIPHDQLQTFYNTYPQYNVDNSVINIQQDQVDIDQLTQAIFDQITSMDQVKGEWKAAEEPVPPEPDPPGPAEDVLSGVNTIIGQQNTQINQNKQDMQIHQQQLQQQQQQLKQQQQISQDTSDISQSIKDATAMPDAQQLPDFKFDLRELFPFCIPFDIYRLLSSFDAEPVAPHVQLPIVIESIGFSYNLDLDFSAWNPVAQAMRTAELIVYAIGLAWATGKVIKW